MYNIWGNRISFFHKFGADNQNRTGISSLPMTYITILLCRRRQDRNRTCTDSRPLASKTSVSPVPPLAHGACEWNRTNFSGFSDQHFNHKVTQAMRRAVDSNYNRLTTVSLFSKQVWNLSSLLSLNYYFLIFLSFLSS